MGVRDHHAVHVQEALETLREPAVVDAVITRAFTQGEHEGDDRAIDLHEFMQLGALMKRLKPLAGQRAQVVHRFLVEGEDGGEVGRGCGALDH